MKRSFVLSAAAALLASAGAAQAQRGRDDHRGRADQQQAQPAQPREEQRQNNNRDRGAVNEQRAEQSRSAQTRPAQTEDRRRDGQYDQGRGVQMQQREQAQQFERAQAAQREEQLERSRAQEREEQLERSRENERRGADIDRTYNRDRDDRSVYDSRDYDSRYRYNVGGAYRETNQYGVDVLQRAVNLGYQEGYRAGQVDRRDRAPADYRRALEYQEGDYGFAGAYVPQGDYAYYFREGFERGYDDAYGNRSRYGTYYNGTPSILGNILSGILGLTTVR